MFLGAADVGLGPFVAGIDKEGAAPQIEGSLQIFGAKRAAAELDEVLDLVGQSHAEQVQMAPRTLVLGVGAQCALVVPNGREYLTSALGRYRVLVEALAEATPKPRALSQVQAPTTHTPR